MPISNDEDNKNTSSWTPDDWERHVLDLNQRVLSLEQQLDSYKNQVEDLTKQNTVLSQKLSKRNTNPAEASKMHSKLANNFAENMYPILDELNSKGHVKCYDIAKQLNGMGLKTRTGAEWNATGVSRLVQRKQQSPDV